MFTYVIRRRPAPGPSAREVALPTQVVVDLTTWGSTRERSRLPVNAYAGYVDILVNPDGSVVPTTVYATSASFGLGSAFLHFWLAERSDLAAPSASVSAAPFLPLPQGLAPTHASVMASSSRGSIAWSPRFSARTGQVTMPARNPPFE